MTNRIYRNTLAFLFGVALVAAVLIAPAPAQAQAGMYSGLGVINKIIANTPGIDVAFSSAGATARAVGTETAVAGGLRIPFMATATVPTTAARIAGLAGGAIRAASFIGVASIVIPWIAGKYGLSLCPAPDFVCKDTPNLAHDEYLVAGHADYGRVAVRSDAVCAALKTAYPTGLQNYTVGWNGAYTCTTTPGGYTAFNFTIVRVCPNGQLATTGVAVDQECVAQGGATVKTPAPEADMTSAIQQEIAADPAKMGSLYTAERAAQMPVVVGTDPATVTAPPVTLPITTTANTVTNPDGSTSTIQISRQTTLTPTQAPSTGATVDNIQLSYPTRTYVTTTTTNNVTNVTTTNITYEDNFATPDAPMKIDLPTDYNREVTQGKILDQLTATNAPDMAPQGPLVTSATAKADADMAAQRNVIVDQQGTGKAAYFAWLWTPPIGSCSPAVGTVHGYSISWDICPTVNNIRDVLGWLMALFSMVTIYGELFKKVE